VTGPRPGRRRRARGLAGWRTDGLAGGDGWRSLAGAAWSGMACLAGTGGGVWPVGIDEQCDVDCRTSSILRSSMRTDGGGMDVNLSVTVSRDANHLSP
jgi:hypothetical protein